MDNPNDIISAKLEEALSIFKEQRGANLCIKIKPILYSNLDRGRVQTFTEGNEKCIHDYVELVAEIYERLSPFIHKLQIERSEEAWKPLMQKMYMWAYSYFLRINFEPGEHTMEIAKERATDAAMTLINAHFPYDTEFDPWARVLLIYECRKFIRSSTKKSNIPQEVLVEMDSLSQCIHERLFDNPASKRETRIDLLDSIAKLSTARQQVILGLYFEGFSSNDLAVKMDKSVGAIYNLHFHALKDLQKILSENGNKYE